MPVEATQIQYILAQTNRFRDLHQERKKFRGENFNVFSVLKMEHRENATHSAFLGELLDPLGTHLMGAVFLKLFLKTVGYQGPLNPDTARLTLEYHIGTRNDKKKTGGRIDIYLQDDRGESISIENKIYAVDQPFQLERYANHNKGKNTVYYLTLDGKSAAEELNEKSAIQEKTNKTLNEAEEQKEEEPDFYDCLSYKQTIIRWLTLCLKEAADQPILRESIKQYMLLIKKITNQLSDNQMEQDLLNLIKANYESAKSLEGHVWKVEVEEAHSFLTDTMEYIKKTLTGDWQVTVDDDLTTAWTGLRITRPEWKGMLVKLEGNSKAPWSDCNYGVHAVKTRYQRGDIYNKLAHVQLLQSGFKNNHAWPYYQKVTFCYQLEDRLRLFDPVKRKALLEEVSRKLIYLAKACEKPLADIKGV